MATKSTAIPVLSVQDHEIRALFYLKRDSDIAFNLGISERRVANLRAIDTTKRQKHVSNDEISGVGGAAGLDDRKSAAMASDTLHRRLWAMFEQVAKDRGLADEYEAMALMGMAA